MRVKGSDGKWIGETFDRKVDADEFESKLIYQKKSGLTVRNIGNQTTFSVIHISRVLKNMNDLGLSKQMQLHVYNLMHKMFEDAIELFEILNRNPVIKKLRPDVQIKESRFLSIKNVKRLLDAVQDSEIETAVWIQVANVIRLFPEADQMKMGVSQKFPKLENEAV